MLSEQAPRYIDFIPQDFNEQQMEKLQEMQRAIDTARSIKPDMVPDDLRSAARHPSESMRNPIPDFAPLNEVFSLFVSFNQKFLEDAKLFRMAPVPKACSFGWFFGNERHEVARTVSEEKTTFTFSKSFKQHPVEEFSVDSNGFFSFYTFPSEPNAPKQLIAEHSLRQPVPTDTVRTKIHQARNLLAPYLTAPRQTSQ